MTISGFDITAFMLDNAFWKTGTTFNEAYLINGEAFSGNILQARSHDEVVITCGDVETHDGRVLSLQDYFDEWKTSRVTDVVPVLCGVDDRARLLALLAEHGFEVGSANR